MRRLLPVVPQMGSAWGSFVRRLLPVVLLLLVTASGSGCHPRIPQAAFSLKALELPERHFAETEDGWRLALFHYPAWFRTPFPLLLEGVRQRFPVILCHGLAANHYTWDLTEQRSMARFLADRGYDVWILDLRGHGASLRPKAGITDPDGWGIDEYALKDVPAAIRYVRQATGAAQVNWVGHSMGGMIIYAYLASTGDPAVRNVVAIGSPGSLDFANDLVTMGIRGTRYSTVVARVPVRFGARGWSRFSGRLINGYEEVFWHADNMAMDAARLMFWIGVEDIERGVQRSFHSMFEAGHFVSKARTVDYEAGLSRFTAPLLAIAGRLDGLASPLSVQRLYDRVASADKTYELISRANGYSVDYGHVDLVMGDHAREDVFPVVHEWLEERQAPLPPEPLTPIERRPLLDAPASQDALAPPAAPIP